ncbi:hydrolase, TatD family [Caldicellulosiruptor kronotskyensis 2002]|uniref:Hydrolase, TatD family n=1 Tax=Caldicellulosiruptor kronotskyensis (strain DSM 18902 / VKM B-2412 / 2002) TaxID=632348 RepID=E4SHB0_CALK2|nr:TatD family hydrolase [Caldicellulosiruptor kronotskyensis]ADQ47135.1 hydrolase, TatD family [Caldicellulosiruptor kronotskyensis 2002]
MIIDVHAHYDDEAFATDLEDVMAKLKEENIIAISSSSSIESSKENIEIAKKYDTIYITVGIHPHEANDAPNDFEDVLFEFARFEKNVAIGEIGLDYHYDFSPRDVQKEVFIRQIEVAKALNLPIVVHSREAHKETLDILLENAVGKIPVLIHCYSGSVEMSRILRKHGIYISVGGVVTFQNAKKLIEVVKEYPLELLMLETDSPYLTPHPHRGKRNDSTYLKYVIQKIAQIKEVSEDLVIEKTTQNARNFFGIK